MSSQPFKVEKKSTWHLSSLLLRSSAGIQQGPQRGVRFSCNRILLKTKRPRWHFKWWLYPIVSHRTHTGVALMRELRRGGTCVYWLSNVSNIQFTGKAAHEACARMKTFPKNLYPRGGKCLSAQWE